MLVIITRSDQLRKKSTAKPTPLQPLPTTDQPNQRIHIDLFGPLKTSVLDHVYTNNNGLIDSISELSVITGDHCPIVVTLLSKIRICGRKISTRNWKDYTKEKLVSLLTQQDWEEKCLDAEDYYDALEQKIMVVYDKLVPLEEKTIRTDCYEPVSITNMKRKRKNLFLNAKRRKSAALFQRCKALSKKIRTIEKESKKRKIRDTILAGGIQGLWHGYRLAEDLTSSILLMSPPFVEEYISRSRDLSFSLLEESAVSSLNGVTLRILILSDLLPH